MHFQTATATAAEFDAAWNANNAGGSLPPPTHPWQRCKQELFARIPGPFFETFIRPIESHPSFDAQGQLLLFVPTDKLRKHIQSRYLGLIESTLSQLEFRGQVSLVTGVPQAEHVSVATSSRAAPTARAAALGAQEAAGALRSSPPSPGGDRRARATDPSWENKTTFHSHAANRSAVEALLGGALSQDVLFVSGPSGCGKSTLGMAAARAARERGQAARYLTLETFLTEFSLACRERNVIDWRRELRAHQLLLIDDVQFLKKTAHKSQEEIRHLIDELQRSGGRLVLFSDVPVARLPLAADLRSRLFLAGELTLLYPDEPARERILVESLQEALRLCGRSATDGPGDRVIRGAAAALVGDGRKLVCAARRLSAVRPDDANAARQAIADLVDAAPQRGGPQRVVELVAAALSVSPSAIRGPARDKRFALARHLVAYLCTELLGLKLMETAAVIGRREHGSVIHARRRIASLMERDLFLRNQVAELSAQILRADGF